MSPGCRIRGGYTVTAVTAITSIPVTTNGEIQITPLHYTHGCACVRECKPEAVLHEGMVPSEREERDPRVRERY